MTHFRFALRLLRKSPAFTLAAVLTMALGIAANTSIFTVVHAVLLQPLPYPAAQDLVMVWQDMRARGGPPDEWGTPGNLADWRSETGTFASIASIRFFGPVLTGLGDPEMLAGEQVTQPYFDVLRVQPEKGRAFRPDECVPNAPRVVIVSHDFWQRRLGGAEDVLSRQLVLAGEPHQIIGVMPAAFRPVIVPNASVWRPDRLNLTTPSRGAIVLRVVARLQTGVTVDSASASMTRLAKTLAVRYPDSNTNVGFRVVPLHEQVVGNARPGMLMLTGAVLLVLLITCVNIANLLLARASGRAREMAVRSALGAGRAQIIRQLLFESIVLASAGGAAGMLLSAWGVKAFLALAPAATPRLNEISLNPLALAFAVGLTLVTGLLFGLAPALSLARTDHAPALKDGGRGSVGASGHRLRKTLIVAEVAITVMLLVGGGLLMRTFVSMQRAGLGFDPDHVLTAFVPIAANRFATAEESTAFLDRLLESARAVPGASRAALTSIVPMAGVGDNDVDFLIEGVPSPAPGKPGPVAWFRVVSAEYLRLMNMSMVKGRSFEGREAEPVVVISETLAKTYWPASSPIGAHVRFDMRDGPPAFTVVGVVADPSQTGARGAPRGQIFIPYWHAGRLAAGGTNVMLKTTVAPESLAKSLADAVRAVDPQLPTSNVVPMEQLISRSVEEPRFLAVITGVFAALTLLLAAVGVYGVMAYVVGERRQELGLRLALGASRGSVFSLVYADGLRLAGIGLALGAAGAAAVAPALTALLYGVKPYDPITFAVTCAVLLIAAAIAVFIPARRAMSVDPGTVLR
jgi:predicted permease